MIGDDIANRLLEFAAEILRIVGALDSSATAKHVARQLTRAGTSGGANYEEARGAESGERRGLEPRRSAPVARRKFAGR